MIQATFYCDESGSTGTNWLDKNQPFFVYGGWLIPNGVISEVKTETMTLFAGIHSMELKSKQVLKRSHADKDIVQLLHIMDEHGATPIFTVSDKEYMLSAKLVETFFDPAYNPELLDSFTRDFHIKKCLADILCESAAAAEFFPLLRTATMDTDTLENVRLKLCSTFSDMPAIAHSLSSITERHLESMIEEFNLPNTWRTLTIPTLMHWLQILQRFSERNNFITEIIHDNLRGYDDTFEEIQATFFTPGTRHIMNIGNSEFSTKCPNITSLNLEDSKSEYMIQLADLLCGFLARCFKKLKSGVSLSDSESSVMLSLVKQHDNVYNWDYHISYQSMGRFLHQLGVLSQVPNPISRGDLNYQFSWYKKK